MDSLTKNKVAAILITLYTLPQLVVLYNWIATDSPMIADRGTNFALSGFALFVMGFMTIFGVWQDQKVYKIIAMIVFGLNALTALPGVLFAPSLGWRFAALSGSILFVAILVLLLRRTQQPVPA